MTPSRRRSSEDETAGAPRVEEALTTLALSMAEQKLKVANLEDRTTALASKLRDVVEALVVADGALAQRLTQLEELFVYEDDPSASQPQGDDLFPDLAPLAKLSLWTRVRLWLGRPIF